MRECTQSVFGSVKMLIYSTQLGKSLLLKRTKNQVRKIFKAVNNQNHYIYSSKSNDFHTTS